MTIGYVVRYVVAAFVVAILLPHAARADEALREHMERLREQKAPLVAGVPLASAQVLDDFYRGREYDFAWTGSRQVAALLELAELSRRDGLQPSDFNANEVRAVTDGRDPASLTGQTRVDADILLSDSLLRLIHHTRYGKVDPRALDPKHNHADGPYSTALVVDLQRVVAAEDLAAEATSLHPKAAFYQHLKEGLDRYRKAAEAGGWPAVPAGASLKPGMRDARVPAVRARLSATGEYLGGEPADPRRYDENLKRAVSAFQKRHNLGGDGVVGPATLAALNVSAQKRVDQIRVNLERMRWVYDELPDDYLLVDIAAQRLHLFRDGKDVWTTRVIVGRPERQTPIFRDRMEYLEFNPTWTVPPTILKEDILPKARGNPDAVRRKGLTVLDRRGRKVAPEAVNWHASAANFPYILRQDPGEKNALGKIKFMFPNRFSVYLHDTPTRHLFGRAQRLYSSGCVRVERPLELAELVLNDPERWNRERLAGLIDSKRTRWVHLKEPLPVILSYWTAQAGEDGQVIFREDIYGRDAQVLAALDGRGPLRLVYVDPVAEEPAADIATDGVPETDPVALPEASASASELPVQAPVVGL